ncbi:hypothetical protein J2W86_000033 [Delftia lacustris]|nr:hypothetical protein [Delftia lacustris]
MAYLPGDWRTASTRPLKSLAGTAGLTAITMEGETTSETMRSSVRGS